MKSNWHFILTLFTSLLTFFTTLVLQPIIKHTIDSIYLLSKLEAQDKIRCTWLMCLVYVLQEAPEVAIRKVLLSLCNEPGVSSKAFFNFLLQQILSTHLSLAK